MVVVLVVLVELVQGFGVVVEVLVGGSCDSQSTVIEPQASGSPSSDGGMQKQLAMRVQPPSDAIHRPNGPIHQ